MGLIQPLAFLWEWDQSVSVGGVALMLVTMQKTPIH